MNGLKVLENMLALTEVISNELALLENKLNSEGYINIAENERLKELRIKNDTIKEIMGVKQFA